MKKIFITISMIMAVCFCKPNLLSAQTNAQDSLALVDLYNSTNGPNWTNNTNWLTNAPVSTWFGITVDENRVSKISFQNNKLSGIIPSTIGNLTSLTQLLLSENQLTGNIPPEIGKLAKLKYLLLDINNLTGNIPKKIGSLDSLVSLVLSNNQLTGSIPTEIGNLSNLENLVLSDNKLTGNIPTQIGKLNKLGYLLLYQNKLSGEIPYSISTLKAGIINITYNKFTFAGMARLVNSHLALVEYQRQKKIDINNIGSLFSVSVGGLLSNNTYKWYKNGSLIATIKGDSTFTATESGTYSVIANNSSVQYLTLYSDSLIFQSAAINKTDSLALVNLYNNTNGANWYTNTNWLTNAPVSTWYGIVVKENRVTEISLMANNLRGELPNSIGNITKLTDLFIGQCYLQGKIPSSIGNLINLKNLSFFAANGLTNIPTSLGNLVKLEYLNLSYNKLNNTLPEELGHLTNVVQILLIGNRLKGSIPSSFGNLQKLKILSLTGNQLSGKIPFSLTFLDSLTSISLVLNKFTFAGMENLVRKFPFADYNNQANIPLHQNNNMLSSKILFSLM